MSATAIRSRTVGHVRTPAAPCSRPAPVYPSGRSGSQEQRETKNLLVRSKSGWLGCHGYLGLISISQADRTRQFAFDRYIARAREQGRSENTIRVGDIRLHFPGGFSSGWAPAALLAVRSEACRARGIRALPGAIASRAFQRYEYWS